MPAEPYAAIALIGAAYWFAYFLVILPILGVIEKPLPSPRPSRRTSTRTTAPTAIRPSERKPSMFRKSHSLPHRPALASVASPRRRRAHIEDVAFAHEGPFGKFDQFQLQRGLQVYTEVCSACHGLKFVPIRSLSDAGGPGLRKTRSGLCQAVSP
jgi:ubiquinol-cytochrome c reductase cytochrome c1 subunit